MEIGFGFFCLHIFQARDGVALGGDLLVWLFNMVTGQGIGIVSHLAGTYFQLPVGIGDFFRNQLSFGYGEIGKNAVVLGPAVDIYAHDLPPCKRWESGWRIRQPIRSSVTGLRQQRFLWRAQPACMALQTL